jgi:hypothetical protein
MRYIYLKTSNQMKTKRTRRKDFTLLPLGEDPSSPLSNIGATMQNSFPQRNKGFTKPAYYYLNMCAAFVHLFIAATLLLIYVVQPKTLTIPLTESFLAWDRPKLSYIDCVNNVCGPVLTDITSEIKANETSVTVAGNSNIVKTCTGVLRDTQNNGEFCIDVKTKQVGDPVDYGALVISFHVLSAFFQFIALLRCYDYKRKVKTGRNWLRFVEYSISASIMLVIIALLNGITDLHILVSIAVLTASCQVCGALAEYIYEFNMRIKWILHFNGWLTFGCAYGIIFRAFFASVEDSEVPPPDFVYVIVFLIFGLYASFGFVQLVEFSCISCACCKCFDKCYKVRKQKYGKEKYLADTVDDKIRDVGEAYTFVSYEKHLQRLEDELDKALKENDYFVRYNGRCNPYYKEMVYIILSLSAKTTLGILLFTNVFMNQ